MSLCKKILAFTLLTLIAFNTNAELAKGDKTISIYGSLISDDTSDTIILFASGGYFTTDTLELQGTIMLVGNSNAFTDSTTTGFGANANLYFPTASNPDFLPYVGGGAQLQFITAGTFTDTNVGINGQVGIKQFVAENVALDYQAQLMFSDNTTFILSAGITIFVD